MFSVVTGICDRNQKFLHVPLSPVPLIINRRTGRVIITTSPPHGDCDQARLVRLETTDRLEVES
jgi:hypothetical protein